MACGAGVAQYQCGLVSIHVWVEFIVCFRPCSEGFSPGSPVFLPPQKSTFVNSDSIREQ